MKADISRSFWIFAEVSSALESCFQDAFTAHYVYEYDHILESGFQKPGVKTGTKVKHHA